MPERLTWAAGMGVEFQSQFNAPSRIVTRHDGAQSHACADERGERMTTKILAAALLATVFATAAQAQCADPPTSPRGRCVKANGGSCDPKTKIWVSPNDQVKQMCAGLSPNADRK